MTEQKIECFDLESGEGEWFPFFKSSINAEGTVTYEDPVDGVGKICLRVADSKFIDELFKQTRKKSVDHTFNPVSRKMERIEFDAQTPEQERKEREMIWDHSIVDWEDKAPFLSKGKPIERTIENKLKLMAVPSFARCVTRCLQTITGMKEESREAEIKN